MDGHYGNRMPYNPGHSPRTPHPAQYFTSGSTPRGGSPMRFSNSTPNQYQQRPPRFQHPNNRYGSSPGGGAYGGYSPSYSSDYPSSPYRPTYSPTPQYTPSPVRPRFNNYNQGASRHSPYHHRGRGGSAGRGGRGGHYRPDGKLPIERYFKPTMLQDPWKDLVPFSFEDGASSQS